MCQNLPYFSWPAVPKTLTTDTALTEAIAVALHLEDADVMCQPVEQRAGEALGTEGFGPLVEGQIAGDQRGAAFIAL